MCDYVDHIYPIGLGINYLHDITNMLLNVALNTINPKLTKYMLRLLSTDIVSLSMRCLYKF